MEWGHCTWRKIRPGGETKVYGRFPRSSHPGRSGRADTESRRGRCTAHLHRHHHCKGPSMGASAGRCGLQEWETTSCHCEELHQAVGTRKPGDNQKRQKLLWAMKAAKDREGLGKNTYKVQWLLWRRRWNVWKGMTVNPLPPVTVDKNWGSRVFVVLSLQKVWEGPCLGCANPKRSKKLNGMRNANSLHNRRSAMKPLSVF